MKESRKLGVRILAVILLLVCFVLPFTATVFADEIIWSGTANDGSAKPGHSSTAGSYSIKSSTSSALAGYRFSLVDSSGELVSGTTCYDVYIKNKSGLYEDEGFNALHATEKYNKISVRKKYASDSFCATDSPVVTLKQDTASNGYKGWDTTVFRNVETGANLGTLPQGITEIQGFFETEETSIGGERVKALMSAMGIEDPKLNPEYYVIVEPIYAAVLQHKNVALTPSEFAWYCYWQALTGTVTYKGQMPTVAGGSRDTSVVTPCVDGSTGSSCTKGCHYDFISNYTQGSFPGSLIETGIGVQNGFWSAGAGKISWKSGHSHVYIPDGRMPTESELEAGFWGRQDCRLILDRGFGVAVISCVAMSQKNVVVYHIDESRLEETPVFRLEYDDGDLVVLQVIKVKDNILPRFGGWKLREIWMDLPAGSEEAPGKRIEDCTGDAEFDAVWYDYVTYRLDGGTFKNTDGTYTPTGLTYTNNEYHQEYREGGSATTISDIPVKDGYTFAGWRLIGFLGGTDSSTAGWGKPKQIYTSSITNESAYGFPVFQAVWEEIPVPPTQTYNVTIETYLNAYKDASGNAVDKDGKPVSPTHLTMFPADFILLSAKKGSATVEIGGQVFPSGGKTYASLVDGRSVVSVEDGAKLTVQAQMASNNAAAGMKKVTEVTISKNTTIRIFYYSFTADGDSGIKQVDVSETGTDYKQFWPK